MSSDLSTLESGTSQLESVSAVSLSCATSTVVGSLSIGTAGGRGEEGGAEGGSTGAGVSPLRRKRKAVKRLVGSPRPKRRLRITGAAADGGDGATSRQEHDVEDLLQNVPEISKEFDIVSRIGEGTFSSVFLASLKGCPEERFALKHLVPTSSSSRIENELRCLQMMGGRDNVISIHTFIRHKDHVVLIMPYFPHDRFTDYLPHLSLSEARDYMRALFLALRNVHSHHTIHRDIKPSNFLYDRTSKQFMLVDFGLAHLEYSRQKRTTNKKPPKGTINNPAIVPSKPGSTKSRGTSTPASVTINPAPSHPRIPKIRVATPRPVINGLLPPHTYQRHFQRGQAKVVRSTPGGASAHARGNPSSAVQQNGQVDSTRSTQGGASAHARGNPSGAVQQNGQAEVERGRGGRNGVIPRDEIWLCPTRHKVTEICDFCMARSIQTAPRAGTPGFRAPEVLLKCPNQTTSVDIWSAGVILLCLLSGRYPFFRAHDDLSAMAQIISLMGSKRCTEAARNYGKELICVPEVSPVDLRALCTSLRASLPLTQQSNEPDLPSTPTRRTKLCNGHLPSGCTNPSVSSPRRKTPIEIDTQVSTHSSPRETKQSQPRGYAADPLQNGRRSLRNTSVSSETAESFDPDASCSPAPLCSWDNVPDSGYDLLYRCLDLNPHGRLSAEEALQHPFLSEHVLR